MKIIKLRVTHWLCAFVMITMLFTEHEDVSAQSATVVPTEKAIALSIKIKAPIDSVWKRWTTEKELQKFFAPVCHIELKPLGLFEILFMPNAPQGQRGAENNRILAVQEKKMISFTWDAPPQYPEIRKQRTSVSIHFYPVTASESIVTLTHTGWGQGEDWNTVFNHFEQAWSGFVLPNLKYSLEVKPIQWTNIPQGLAAAEKISFH